MTIKKHSVPDFPSTPELGKAAKPKQLSVPATVTTQTATANKQPPPAAPFVTRSIYLNNQEDLATIQTLLALHPKLSLSSLVQQLLHLLAVEFKNNPTARELTVSGKVFI